MAAIRGCEICKQIIDPERAENDPETKLCSEHAEAIKKYNGEFLFSSRPEVTSKAGGMKRNYGGVEITKERNEEGIRKLREEYLLQAH